ncbi:hypothetical protein FQR65_LT16469 [Abscondita terminalis]|nr:hypothetical protein FQR65_LT16469 [Abscondita terminalis]
MRVISGKYRGRKLKTLEEKKRNKIMKNGKLIILSGPSGVGKGSVNRELAKDASLKLKYSVSMTTRTPRVGEVDGVNYFFVNHEEFKDAIEHNELLEHAEFIGNYYGTPRSFIKKETEKGNNVILEIEVIGATQVLKKEPKENLISIFLMPPSLTKLEARLRSRGTEEESVIKKRLDKALIEIPLKHKYQYVIENDNVENAVAKIKDVLLKEGTLEEDPNTSYYISNSSVEIVKSFSQKDTGFVNYVIRNKFEEPSLFEVNIKNKKNILPLTYGFPFWLYQKISKEYSENIANKLVVDSVNIPGINFRVNTLKISQKEFEEKYKDLILQKSTIAKNNYLGNSNLINSHVFKEGLVIIQDQTSSLVSEILEPSLNSKVLDMCCAPGGKLTHISAIMQNTGQVYGCEINSNKVKLIEENIEKLGVTNVKVLNQDALNIKEKDFDFILLDAPCSGIGVIKRKPEIKFQKENSIFKDNLYSLQSSLLDKAAILLKVGGTLVYSTCTINLLENQKQILDFLNRFNNFELKYEKQFFGFENENDGFYIAKEFLIENYKSDLLKDLVIEESKDGTIKILFMLDDKKTIETVMMPQKYGQSVCVTTQVGCKMACKFCASGLIKTERNLSTGEIVRQIYTINKILKDKYSNEPNSPRSRVSHIVVMGIGEPMDNFINVMNFINVVNDSNGFEIGARHITISTCGVVPKIKEFADMQTQINLAISLHAPNNEVRNTMMPINKAFPVEMLIDSVKYYVEKTNRRITFEYILIDGVNDSAENARELANLIRGINGYVNLIPYNEVEENPYKQSTRVSEFFQVLKKQKINAIVRKEFGADIDAACGQLRAKREGVIKNEL